MAGRTAREKRALVNQETTWTIMLSGNNPTNGNRSRSFAPKSVSSERRNRPRLRDLCDEVLASHRAASDRDVVTVADRADAQIMLAKFAPLGVAK